ncbi:MAG: hypothetical protein KDJ36_00440 [Hyphomicrobiaceae bacterium]|nr:hypothetical protein [Hyphomicrobiaceae bacterium]
MSLEERPSLAGRIVRRVPVVGYAVRCAEEERPGELLLLAANAIMAGAVITLAFGYPGFVTVILTATVMAALTILAATRS